jgi:phage I-like protein
MNTRSSPLAPDAELRIIPSGRFRANDGRAHGNVDWHINGQVASKVIARASARSDAIVIDYNHQSLSGNESPAAGWFKQLKWYEGDGLYMTGISWTARAKAMIAANEYRYLSPAFRWDATSGDVEEVVSVGLTNTPALNGLTDLAIASLSAAGHPVCAHFELFNAAAQNESVVAALRQQQSVEHFKQVFGFDLPASASVVPRRESFEESVAKLSAEGQASLRKAFGHLV